MNWQPAQNHYSITEYLNNEQDSDSKHEYIDGQVYAMAGASKNHQRIISNLVRLLSTHLKNTPCDTFASDIKVKVSDFAFFYPDVIVACEPDTDNDYYTEQPLIIVEVLSKSTRRVDETTKRRLYQSLPSLQEYVLIEQDIVDIEICRRSEGWQPEHYFMGDGIVFAAIELTVSVNEIYERVVNDDVRTFFETLANNAH
ncbi:MAG: Uma2 family endonuclease [Methylococcales bacterium]